MDSVDGVLGIEHTNSSRSIALSRPLFMWALLFRPGYSEHDMGLMWVVIGFGIGFASLIFAVHTTRDWPTITRGLRFRSRSLFRWTRTLAQLAATPWLQENGRLPNEVVLWPALIVLGIPGIVVQFSIESVKTMPVNSS